MASKEFWQEVIEKYSSYEGSVTKFCQEQSISKSQFYYHKRMLDNDNNKFVSTNSILSTSQLNQTLTSKSTENKEENNYRTKTY